MTIDERIEALVMSCELMQGDLERMKQLQERDSENIRALARIAEIHERRLTDIEGGDRPS
jgi:hypothetical protein